MSPMKLLIAAGATAALAVTAPAMAKEYIYGSWVSAKHGVNADALVPMFKAMEKESNGALKWKMLAGGQVVSARSTLVYMTIFTWNTVAEAIYQTSQLEIWETGTTMIPIWPSRWVIPIGCGAMVLFVVFHLVRDLRGNNDRSAP